MIDFRTSGTIDRPVEDVWAYMADLRNAPDWELFQEYRPVSLGPIHAGWRYQQIGHLLGRTLVMDSVMSEWEPNRKMTLHADNFGPLKDASLTFMLEPIDGKTRVTKWARGRLWGAWRLLGPFALPMLKKEDEIGNLKRILESGVAQRNA